MTTPWAASQVCAILVSALSFFSVARAATHTVLVQDSFYEPLQLAVNIGDTVVWHGLGAQDHTVTSDTGLFDASALYGEIFSYTFVEAGLYPYYCFNHGNPGGDGMSGTIVVSANTANQPPHAPFNLLPVNGATNQPTTLQLRANAFSDPDVQDFHAASEWLVRRASDGFVVFNSGEDSVNKTNRALPAGALGYGTNYAWQVRYKDGRGLWSLYSTPTTFRTLSPVTEEGTGLKGSYGNGGDLNPPLAVVTNAAINFDWGNARPHRRITAEGFVVRWEGSLLPEFTERYDIQFQYRGGARVWVNDQLLIDEWAGCSFGQARRGSINLIGGQLAKLRVDYAADPAGARAALRWASASLPMEVIPTARLFPVNP